MSSQPQTAATSTEPLRYRFGTFELDTRSAELRRSGVKLRLQEQPFQVLKRLLERPAEVVTREELQAALWPADTFVDFDTSLNTAIKRLREALGDSADLPVFIETIPRRGYRFIAPVQEVGSSAKTAGAADEAPARVARDSRRAKLPLWMLAAVGIAGVAAGGLVVALRSPKAVARVADSTQITFDGAAKFNVHEIGGSIFYNQRDGSRVRLMKIPADGGPPVTLNDSSPGLYLADVSTDGTKLILGAPVPARDEGSLKIMDLASGLLVDVPSVVGDDVTGAQGGKVLYSRGRDLFLANADGGEQRKILQVASGTLYRMQMSPDGRRLRFTVGDKAHSYVGIWEANADGSNLHQVLQSAGDTQEMCCGIWTTDGKYFFFDVTRNGTTQIWLEPQRGSFWSREPGPAVPLTTGPLSFKLGSMGWDGKSLVVTASQPRPEVMRFDAATGKFERFLNGVSGVDVEASRDGQRFVYVRYPEQTLWIARSDGSDATQLTGPALHVALPHWSPDGKWIAFSGMRTGQPWNVFLIPSAGGPAEQVTHGAIADLDASWSPDGKTIAFAQARDDGGKPLTSVQFLDVATRKVTKLADSDGICCTRYSPDGRYLLASHSSYNDLLLYDSASQKWTTLVKDQGMLGYMNWTPDGKYVLFDTLEVETPRFYRVRMKDLVIEPVADIGEIRRYYGAFGPWAGIWSDGSPLLVRDASNEEIYSLKLDLP